MRNNNLILKSNRLLAHAGVLGAFARLETIKSILVLTTRPLRSEQRNTQRGLQDLSHFRGLATTLKRWFIRLDPGFISWFMIN